MKKSKENNKEEIGGKRKINSSILSEVVDEPLGDGDGDDDDKVVDLCQWEKVGNKIFYPISKIEIKKSIPPGYYKIGFDRNRGSYFVNNRTILTDELIELPIDKGLEIVKDIKNFWSMKDRYNKYDLVHKRGILMYGPPGSGKTCILNQLITMLVGDYKGLVFSIEDENDLSYYDEFSKILREIEPNRPIITIIEDIDGLLDGGRGVEKMLLNILDGINQIDNVAYIATTNYPERMQARLINRPGRFDRRFKIGYPTAKVRKAFFESKMYEEDFKKFSIKDMVQKTSELTVAHCKEIFTEHVIKERDLDEVVNEMKKMNTDSLSSSEDMKKGKMGFVDSDVFDDGFDDLEWKISDAINKIKKERRIKTVKK